MTSPTMAAHGPDVLWERTAAVTAGVSGRSAVTRTPASPGPDAAATASVSDTLIMCRHAGAAWEVRRGVRGQQR